MSMESNFNYKKMTLWNFLSMSANTKMLVTLQVSTFICGKHVETEIGRYVFKKSDGYFLTPDPQSGKSIMNGFEDKIDSRNLIVESYRVNCRIIPCKRNGWVNGYMCIIHQCER